VRRVHILAAVLEALTVHARREAPNECCGFLVGTPDRIDESVAVANVAASPTRFRIDPAEHIALNRRLRGSGRSIVGVYHSHPTGRAEPSPTDIAEAHYPEFVHLIVSLTDSHTTIRAYDIREGRATAVDIAPGHSIGTVKRDTQS
jgi:proteasome lid subunit RPN8/RPN11